jgi:hypothetical protein
VPAWCRAPICVGGGDDVDAAAGEEFEAEVVAAFGPFIGALGRDRTDETDDGLARGEDRDGVGASADLVTTR